MSTDTLRHRLLQAAFSATEFVSARTASGRPLRPSDILILTAYTPNIADYARLATENKRGYAARHGYAFQVMTSAFDPSRPPAWSKIRFIQRALRDYLWVFWTDADALIMNGRVRLETFLSSEADVRLSRALTPFPHLNTGHMFFRRCPFSSLFLRTVWNLKVFTHDSSWEQRAVNHLAESFSFARLRISPNRDFNAYGEIEGDPTPYQPGDFIVHFPGHQHKMDLMRRYAALAATPQ